MATTRQPSGEWLLAEMTLDQDGTTTVDGIRPLLDSERDAALIAIERLNRFSGPALIGALADAWDGFRPFLHLNPDPSYPTAIGTAEFRAKVGAKMSHWLTTFSAFRVQLERTSEVASLVGFSSTRANFEKAYREHAEYRLAWELRNLDQHDPPAGVVLTYRAEAESGGFAALIDLRRLFADRAVAGRTGKAWRECAALWTGRDEVPARALFGVVMNACQILLADAVTEAEAVIIEDVARLATLHLEALKVDGMPILFHLEPHGGGKSTMQQVALNPEVFVDTLTVLSAARQVLGRPALDFANDSRFRDALNTIAAMEAGREGGKQQS